MSICKSCGGNIKWTKLEGRWRCFNAGTEVDHWDACSKRRWAQVKATGERFENQVPKSDKQTRSGYAKSIHGTKFDRIAAKSIKGIHYKPSGQCRQCVPPWSVCQTCPDAFQ